MKILKIAIVSTDEVTAWGNMIARRKIWSSGYQCRAGRQTISTPCTRIADPEKPTSINLEQAFQKKKKGVVQVKLNLARFRCVMICCIQDRIGRSKLELLVDILSLKQPSDCRAMCMAKIMACSDICWSARTDIAHGMQQPR